jgi:hypothetical protein
MFWLYHRFGHPWRLILQEALKMQPEKISNEEEADSNDQNDMVQVVPVAEMGNNSDVVIDNEENEIEVEIEIEQSDEENNEVESSTYDLQNSF